jgi:hypothetical protein
MRSCSVRSAEIQQRIRPNFAGIPSRLQAPTLSLLGAPNGVLSPLLANIALSVLDEHFTAAWAAMGDSSARHRRRHRGEATYRLVRYADDFVVLVHGTKAHAEHLRDEAAAVLAPMGLRLSDEKTRICHIDDGFDFLGVRIQRQPKRGSGNRPSTPGRPRKRSARSKPKYARRPAKACTNHLRSCSIGSRRSCGAGPATSATACPRRPSTTCAASPGAGLPGRLEAPLRLLQRAEVLAEQAREAKLGARHRLAEANRALLADNPVDTAAYGAVLVECGP